MKARLTDSGSTTVVLQEVNPEAEDPTREFSSLCRGARYSHSVTQVGDPELSASTVQVALETGETAVVGGLVHHTSLDKCDLLEDVVVVFGKFTEIRKGLEGLLVSAKTDELGGRLVDEPDGNGEDAPGNELDRDGDLPRLGSGR